MTLESLTSPEALSLVFIILFCLVLFIFMIRRTHRKPSLRRILALERLMPSIGVAVESGKRVHVCLGRGGLHGFQGPSAMTGLVLLGHALSIAQKSDRPPMTTTGEANLVMLAECVNQHATREHKLSGTSFPGVCQVSGLTPFSYSAGALLAIRDEHVSVNILAGHFGAEITLLLGASPHTSFGASPHTSLGAGAEAGTFTLAGSDSLPAQAIIYASTDEPLIGEELYASGGYLQSRKPFIASLQTQDVFRWILVLALITGSLLKLLGRL